MKLYRYFMAAVVMAAVLTGCRTRVDPYYPRENQRPGNNQGQQQGQQGQEPEQELTLKENTTWEISYGGRKLVGGAYVEEIQVNNVAASQKYLVSVINKANYSTYKGDVEAFLKNEFEYNSEYVYQGAPEVIKFDRFRHGTWYAFIIGLSSDNKLTGEYASCKFTVEEEEASEEYLSWLGKWTVSDGNISHKLNITQVEANLVYRVDNWEVRENAPDGWVNMDLEWIEAFFEPADGRLYFVSQYIQSYKDEDLNKDVDELFLGQIDYDGISEEMGLYIISDENMDLAYAEIEDDNKARIYPCDVSANVGNDKYEGKFYCMQYIYVYLDGKEKVWNVYNQNVLSFFDDYGGARKVSMVRDNNGGAAPTSIVRRNGKVAQTGEEKPLRGRVYKPREGRVATAVKL